MNKLLFCLSFMFLAQMLSAQYMSPLDATQTLQNEALALENGTVLLKDDPVLAATLIDNATVSGTSLSMDVDIEWLSKFGFPSALKHLALEITQAGDTAQGIQNAQTFLATQSSNAEQKEVIDLALNYAIELVKI